MGSKSKPAAGQQRRIDSYGYCSRTQHRHTIDGFFSKAIDMASLKTNLCRALSANSFDKQKTKFSQGRVFQTRKL
ncbi:hypothetical protein CCACVL1_30434 [Corchorus capsularis]|uniref:Uncharacterized protein n=1 Tax=Corchorus capsularis TaxID=210143 RepID=A0A1R3FX74_COCAP|nr:hypothetical protein CCACVL1_30434 [Corchorus capsularis]